MMRIRALLPLVIALLPYGALAASKDQKKDRNNSTDESLKRFVEEAKARNQASGSTTTGSLWTPSARFLDLGADLRASRVDDIVTIEVVERSTASSKGTTKTARTSSAKASVNALGIVPRATGVLPNLARLSSDAQLNGEGTTTRESEVRVSLGARVVEVLPNGFLVVEGVKKTTINSELQTVVVRGVLRPFDLGPANTVRSDRLAQMEVFLNGKGVVGDAVRRPFILYRILLGLLPF